MAANTQAKVAPRQVAAFQSLRPVVVDTAATCGAQIGVNLLMADGSLATTAKLASLFGAGATSSDGTVLDTTDDLEEGQFNLWFTDRRAQDAVTAILADTATIDFSYTAGASLTADLKDLADTGTGAALVKITRDSKGRISGSSAATTSDLAEGDNLYFTDERAQDAAGAALDGTGDVPLTYDDAGAKISAALSAGVLASLALADSATQPGDLATVATTGAYADLSGLPTLGTAAATDATDYATAAQGALADTALQSVVPGTNVSVDNTDPRNPVISATGGGGSGDVVGPASATDGDVALFDGTTGKLIKSGGALNKTAVGLGNVDNTSDADKPVSTAQAAALAAKRDKSDGTFTVDVSAPNLQPNLTVTDWNEYTANSGAFFPSSVSGSSNGPGPNFYSGVRVFRSDVGSGAEIVARETIGSPELWFRGWSAGTTTAWKQAATTDQLPVDTGWQTLTPQNSWSNTGSPYATAACRKLGSFVTLRGTIIGGTIANGTTVATLPSGYRPPADLQFAIATTSSSALARMVIRSSGAIQIYNIDVASMSLDGTSFFVD